MVKFGKYLQFHCVPEWQHAYVKYKALKKIIKQIASEQQPNPAEFTKSDTTIHGPFSSIVQSFLVNVNEESFFRHLDEDFTFLEKFYLQQEEYFLSKTELLYTQLSQVMEIGGIRGKRKRILERAIRELYRGLGLMKNLKILNYTAFIKILKKHDKHSNFQCLPMLTPPIQNSHFMTSRTLDLLFTKVEKLYGSLFTQRERKKAIFQLKSFAKQNGDLDSSTIRKLQLNMCLIGLCVGVSLVLFIVLCLMITFLIDPQISLVVQISPVLPVFRCTGLLLLYLSLWGLNLYLFEKYHINSGFILGCDSSSQLDYSQLWKVVGLGTVLWLSALDYYLYSSLIHNNNQNDPAQIHLMLFLCFLFVILCPFNCFYRSSRLFLGRTLWNIIRTPFITVQFKDFYTCNQLCSLVSIFNDLSYCFCFYLTGDYVTNDNTYCSAFTNEYSVWVISLLPYYWRLLQCLRRYSDSNVTRNLYNAGKYSTSLLVTTFKLIARHYPQEYYLNMWITFACVGTLYSYIWDVKQDWGLFSGEPYQKKQYKFLRKKLVISSDYNYLYYYCAIVSDLFLRAAWVSTISPGFFPLEISKDYASTIVYGLEICRRAQWNFYRMENEHLNNVEKFRAVDVVPLHLEPLPDSGEINIAHTSPQARISLEQRASIDFGTEIVPVYTNKGIDEHYNDESSSITDESMIRLQKGVSISERVQKLVEAPVITIGDPIESAFFEESKEIEESTIGNIELECSHYSY